MFRYQERKMIFISVALFPEAKPWIETLGLKILRDQTPFPVYQNENHTLVVSGMGKINSAMSVAFLLNEFKTSIGEFSWILNLGICGAPKPLFEIGESFLIHKITDQGSGKNVYPDILFRHSVSEASLITVDRPVFENETKELPNTLVDMEAFGFFQAARKFFTGDKIRIVKTVSDHFTKFESSEGISATDRISKLIAESIPKVRTILSIPVSASGEVRLQPEENFAFNEMSDMLRLSETEAIQLKDWMIGYKIRTGNSCEPGLAFLKNTNGIFDADQTQVKTREEGKKGLNALRKFYQF